MAAWGVVTLKIYGGTGRAVGRKVIEEGHRHGMAVTGHLYKYTPLEAAEDGIDSIEHISAGSIYGYLAARTTPPSVDTASARTTGPELDLNSPVVQELVAALVKHKVMVDPTLVVFRNMLLLPDLPGVGQDPGKQRISRKVCETSGRRMRPHFGPKHWKPESRSSEGIRTLQTFFFGQAYRCLQEPTNPSLALPPGFSLHRGTRTISRIRLTPCCCAASCHNQSRPGTKARERPGKH